jgi:hypothetical protein
MTDKNYQNIDLKNKRSKSTKGFSFKAYTQYESKIDKNKGNICEGCFKMDAYKSCVTCGKIYCKMCDFQIHIGKQNSDHKRARVIEAQHIINRCADHQLKLKYFCDTCNLAVCEVCSKEGKHSSKLHSISIITDSFNVKFAQLNSFVSKELMNKYVKLHEKLKNIEDFCQKVRETSARIEKNIKEFQSKIVERLK